MARGDYQITAWSNAFSLTVRADKPTASLTADQEIIPLRGSVTLTCSVFSSTGWKFDWFRQESESSGAQLFRNNEPNGVISISDGGLYSCRGGRGDPVFYTENSNKVTTYKTVFTKPTVTLQPNWSPIFRGEKVTLRCEIHGGGGAQWTYEWSPTSRNSPTSSEYRINKATEYYSGEYRCMARRGYQITAWSNAFRLTVRDKPTASLTAGDEITPLGGSVTLTCSVSSSTGWKFDWFRQESESSGDQLIRNNKPDGVIRISEGGLYSCRGGRGDPVFYTENSSQVTIYETVSKPTVILQPNWPQIFRGEKVSLRCEIHGGGGAQWTYEWRPTSSDSPTSSEYWINTATESGGKYWCRARGDYQITAWSYVFKLTVRDKPTASLTAVNEIIPLGGSVTLTCSVSSSTGWKFDWFRQKSKSSGAQLIRNNEPDGVIIISEGGLYSCRGGRGDPVFYTESSNKVTIYKTVPIIPTVTLQPNWPQIFRGEKVTLRCEIHGGGGTQWTHEWSPTSSNSPTSSEYRINKANSGEYRCRGRTDVFTITEWGVLRLTLSDKPQPVLSVSPSWLSPGASVTLSCGGLEHPSAGWMFFWYKVVPAKSSSSYSFELLTGRTGWTEQNSYLINGQNHTAGYVCRAGRGEPVFYTKYSEAKFVWSADSHPAASLSVAPDRVQHFINQSVTLSCSGNNTEWKLRRFTETGGLSDIHCSNWGTMTGSSCSINTDWSHSGVYWCESGSGDFSNAVNITVQETSSSPVSSSFYVLLIVGTVFGIILLILPLMLWRCRRSKDSNSSRSYRTNQKSATNPGAETNDHSSATKDDVLYASVNPGATGSEEPTEITYSIIPLKKLRKKNRHCEPEDGVIYSEVKPGAAEPTPLYAEINHKNKAKKKKDKKIPAATEETVYSEIQS